MQSYRLAFIWSVNACGRTDKVRWVQGEHFKQVRSRKISNYFFWPVSVDRLPKQTTANTRMYRFARIVMRARRPLNYCDGFVLMSPRYRDWYSGNYDEREKVQSSTVCLRAWEGDVPVLCMCARV